MLALPTARAEEGDPFAAGAAAYEAGDYETARALWQPLAEAGDPRAQYWLSDLYRFELGVARDYLAARDLLKQAADQTDNPDILRRAAYALGYMADDGLGMPEDDDKAECLYRVAAENGYDNAQFALYRFLTLKPGISFEALNWAERGAAQGDHRSLAAVGDVGIMMPGREERLEGYLFLILAEKQGNDLARRRLAEVRAEIAGRARAGANRRTEALLREAEALARDWTATPEAPPSPPVTVPQECWP